MFDLLMEPVKLFISGGMEKFAASKELMNIRIVCLDRLLREVRFNKEILNEVKGSLAEDSKPLIECLKNDAFDSINAGAIPMSLIVSGVLDTSRSLVLSVKDYKTRFDFDANSIQRFCSYLGSTITLDALVDRVYFRMLVAQVSLKPRDYEYIRFMFSILEVELVSVLDDLRKSEVKAPNMFFKRAKGVGGSVLRSWLGMK